MIRTLLLGLVLGILAAFPSLALAAAHGGEYTAGWLLNQPLVLAFAAGAAARPHLVRRVRSLR